MPRNECNKQKGRISCYCLFNAVTHTEQNVQVSWLSGAVCLGGDPECGLPDQPTLHLPNRTSLAQERASPAAERAGLAPDRVAKPSKELT
jgi:hypothetical protein